jgi:hypothetical protein
VLLFERFLFIIGGSAAFVEARPVDYPPLGAKLFTSRLPTDLHSPSPVATGGYGGQWEVRMESQMLKYRERRILRENTEMPKKKKSLLEGIPALVLLGLLAGAVGGLGIGLIQLKAASSTASSASK